MMARNSDRDVDRPNHGKSGDAEDRFIGELECERISGLSRTTRWRLERKGRFPKRRQISDNRIAWLLSELEAWRAAPSRETAASTPAA